MFSEMGPKMKKLILEGYKIVIFTNQTGSKFNTKIFAKKVRKIAQDLEISMQVYGCTTHGYCRKPSVGMWRLLERNNSGVLIDRSKSFYVGDAIPGAFSDSDYKFALNLGIDFFSPNDFFYNSKTEYNIPVHPLTLKTPPVPEVKPKETQELIIMVGPPASGKSTLSKEFETKHDYVIACQDDLGTKAKVIRLTRKSLAEGKSVIIDRKNEYVSYRKEFLDIAHECGVMSVRIFWFDIPRKLSEHLSAYREIMTDKHIPQIVFNKYYSKTKGMEKPTKEEDSVIESVTRFGFKRNDAKVVNKQVFDYYLTG